MIIGLAGLMGAGKDTVANYYEANFGFRKVSFADPLRKLAAEINPIVHRWNPSPYKDKEITIRYNDAIEEFGYTEAKEEYPEVRRFLQELGKRLRDNFGEDILVKKALEGVKPWEKIVVSDVRFPNEAETIWNMDGYILLINGRTTHKSLKNLDATEEFALSVTPDAILHNNGTLPELEFAALQLYRDMEDEYNEG